MSVCCTPETTQIPLTDFSIKMQFPLQLLVITERQTVANIYRYNRLVYHMSDAMDLEIVCSKDTISVSVKPSDIMVSFDVSDNTEGGGR